jgi:hypothetical protein
LQRTRPSRSGCNRAPSCAGSLSFGRSASECVPSGGLGRWSLTHWKSLCYGHPLCNRTVSEGFTLWRLKKI